MGAQSPFGLGPAPLINGSQGGRWQGPCGRSAQRLRSLPSLAGIPSFPEGSFPPSFFWYKFLPKKHRFRAKKSGLDLDGGKFSECRYVRLGKNLK